MGEDKNIPVEVSDELPVMEEVFPGALPDVDSSETSSEEEEVVEGPTATINIEATKNNLNMKDLYECMKCQGCGNFPSPYERFLCEDGHLLCVNCGMTQILQFEGVCVTKIKGMDEPGIVANESSCQKKIRKCPADPLYTALYSQAIWCCPYEECEVIMKGQDVFQHLTEKH